MTKKKTSPPQDGRDYPVLGCMKGTVTIAEGVDLTAPTLADWNGELTVPGITDRDDEPPTEKST